MQDTNDGKSLANSAQESPAEWVILLALCTGFTLSQAFRSVPAMMATKLQADFLLTPKQLGVFAGTFHFSFAVMQLFMGICIDIHGVRRTVLGAFPFVVAGSLLSALAPNFSVLILGQFFIGMGCSPAFLVCTVYISRHFAPKRFAAVSGIALGIGGLGMLATGTPLAWLVQEYSWRNGFVALGAGSVMAWLIMFSLANDCEVSLRPQHLESVSMALRHLLTLFGQPQTVGIMALGAVTYASYITLRGLWLGPLLIERFGYTLVQSGNVALAVSALGMVGPAIFGKFDPKDHLRRRWIVFLTLAQAIFFVMLAWSTSATLTISLIMIIGFLSGYMVFQYADVRRAYPNALIGRAMAMFTMSMFMGVALMQWITGISASMAKSFGVEPNIVVLCMIAVLLLVGALAFVVAPRPVVRAL